MTEDLADSVRHFFVTGAPDPIVGSLLRRPYDIAGIDTVIARNSQAADGFLDFRQEGCFEVGGHG